MSTRIGFAGDVMLGRNVDEYQRHRPPAAVWGDLRQTLAALEGFVVNLECVLTTRTEQWTRTRRPFHFRADPEWAVPALEAAGVDCCALANNHVLDYETTGLEDTLDHLDGAGIAHAGAGRNRESALEPAVFEAGDLRVAVVALTDNTPEFSAGEDDPGTARVEFDPAEKESRHRVREAIRRAEAADPDMLVASLHWGPNMVEYPPDEFRAFGHWLVDQGVDFVHGHSAHVFQGVEVYDGVPVCYDAGDFVDDYRVDPDLRNDRGFLFEADVTGSGDVNSLTLRPTEITACRVQRAGDDAAAWCRQKMRERSTPFETEFEQVDDALVVRP